MSKKMGAGLEIIGLVLGLVLVAFVVMGTYKSLGNGTSILGEALVTNVIDGDTIDVLYADGRRESVRLIGIDTPEIDWSSVSTGNGTIEAECYAFEAKDFLTGLVKDKEVILRMDDAQPEYDAYDRRLAYVFLDDSNGAEGMVNLKLIRDGYARELTVGEDYHYTERFRSAQAEAVDASLGRWGACAP